jgi:hypothetical protein
MYTFHRTFEETLSEQRISFCFQTKNGEVLIDRITFGPKRIFALQKDRILSILSLHSLLGGMIQDSLYQVVSNKMSLVQVSSLPE